MEGLPSLSCARAPMWLTSALWWRVGAWGGSRSVRKAAVSGSERADSCRHVPRICMPVRGVGASMVWVRGRLVELFVRARSRCGGPVHCSGAWMRGVGPGGCGTQRRAGASARTVAGTCRACVCQCGEWRQPWCGCAEGLPSLSCARAPIVVDQCIMVAHGCVGWVQVGAERSGKRVRARG